jgi:hypothetical protein
MRPRWLPGATCRTVRAYTPPLARPSGARAARGEGTPQAPARPVGRAAAETPFGGRLVAPSYEAPAHCRASENGAPDRRRARGDPGAAPAAARSPRPALEEVLLLHRSTGAVLPARGARGEERVPNSGVAPSFPAGAARVLVRGRLPWGAPAGRRPLNRALPAPGTFGPAQTGRPPWPLEALEATQLRNTLFAIVSARRPSPRRTVRKSIAPGPGPSMPDIDRPAIDRPGPLRGPASERPRPRAHPRSPNPVVGQRRQTPRVSHRLCALPSRWAPRPGWSGRGRGALGPSPAREAGQGVHRRSLPMSGGEAGRD